MCNLKMRAFSPEQPTTSALQNMLVMTVLESHVKSVFSPDSKQACDCKNHQSGGPVHRQGTATVANGGSVLMYLGKF